MKKVGKTTRQFRYDLNQIPYNYVVEVIKEIQGNKSDRMPEQLWTGVHHFVQEAMIKTILRKKKRNKAKWLSEEALQTAMTIREKERKVKSLSGV